MFVPRRQLWQWKTKKQNKSLREMDSDKLAVLVSMGFDIDLCEAILQIENLTIEEAVQRLLEAQQRNSAKEESSQTSTYTSTTSHIETVEHEKQTDADDAVVSRMALSERQRELKEEFERKEREEVQSAVRKRKLQDKNAKQNILQEIEANKRRIRHLRSDETARKEEDKSDVTNAVKQSKEGVDSNAKLCRIQIRLPSGRSLVHQFPEVSLLSDVMDFAKENVGDFQELTNSLLIRPFPRREYSNGDLSSTLLSLGLCPNASLVLMLQRHTAQSGVCNVAPASTVSSRMYDGGATNNIHSVHLTPHVLHHEWGAGACLTSNPSLDSEGHSSDGPNENEERRTNIQQSAVLRALIDASENTTERSVAETVSTARQRDIEEPKQRNIAVVEAVERRRALQISSGEADTKTGNLNLERNIQSLIQLCADCIAKSLASQQGAILSHIGRTLSHQAAAQVISALKARKLLTGKLLQLFHPCKLLNLDLDRYALTSNEILEAARLHTTLVSLHLSQCSLLTDSGVITAVKGLKHLQIIDLCGCVQITDRALHDIKDLTQLKSLKLDNTKIKDDGLRDFLFGGDRRNLLEFSANATNVSEKAFNVDDKGKVFNVTTLHLDRTMVSSMEFVTLFPSLRNLSLSGTPLVENTFHGVSCLRNLEELNLSHTTITDHSLQHVSGLTLKCLGLPDRLHITDAALQYLEGLPLRSLDLVDYIHVTDAGLASVGRITSLTSLSLANTKVTNDGIRHVKSLVNLQELDLARTHIGDEAIRMIKGLKSLRTLSLTATRITNEIFKDGTINSFENLQKLNISRNKISDAGICHLSLMFLELINADQTYISLLSATSLPGCPNLRALRAQNCRPPSELEAQDGN
ncbi:internalin I-like isoform X2 [Rhopilema esculentum]|uniref:internalin I-like isoform X2 n=1 Tax=Rhopilema esculentum TaxID=499914 RepID=UPI0031DD3940